MFQEAPKSVGILANELIEKYHPDLGIHGVKIQYVLAFAKRDEKGNPAGPALKLHGVPCNGIAKILSLKDRCLRGFDVEISLDGDQWPSFNEARKLALLDHELHHFIVSKDGEGSVKYDAHNRPKLEMRKHDYDFGWFTVIANRHGEASFEVEQAKILFMEAGQAYFPFIDATGALPKRRTLSKLTTDSQ